MSKIQRRYSTKDILFFLDATMLRVWYLNPSKKGDFEKFVLSDKRICKLSEKEREQYRIVSREFGDDIFTIVSDEYMFAPSFYGRKMVRGMHGYLPKFESQYGICVTNDKNFILRVNKIKFLYFDK